MGVTKKSLINYSATRKTTANKAPKAKAVSTVESAKMVSAMRMAKASPKATLAKANLAKATTARATFARSITAL